jgi:hypothetical protein
VSWVLLLLLLRTKGDTYYPKKEKKRSWSIEAPYALSPSLPLASHSHRVIAGNKRHQGQHCAALDYGARILCARDIHHRGCRRRHRQRRRATGRLFPGICEYDTTRHPSRNFFIAVLLVPRRTHIIFVAGVHRSSKNFGDKQAFPIFESCRRHCTNGIEERHLVHAGAPGASATETTGTLSV